MGKTNLLGAWGEELAAKYLQKKGYRLLGCNYKCRHGEIDLIMSQGKYLVFVEVKQRKSARFGEAKEFVTASKQQKVRITASLYLQTHETNLQPRFDVVEVYAPDGLATKNPTIHHLENAF